MTDSSNFREIERRFLVAVVPEEVKHSPFVNVEQGYISGHPVTVRIRRISNEGCFLTVKRGGLPNREEREIPLNDAQFAVLWPITEGWRIEKTRYRHSFGALLIELDVFHGRHKGLIIAEVEFPDMDAAIHFTSPEWFGEEITQNSAYSNSRLAEA